MINILLFDSSRVELNDGYTANDYIIRANAEKVSYETICRVLKLTFDEARSIYDKVWNLPMTAIGNHKRLQTIRTGTDWRHTT